MQKVCKFCHVIFEGRKERLFCSRDCWEKYNKSKTTYCEICGAPLTPKQRGSGSRCCSRKCGGIFRTGKPRKTKYKDKKCLTCGKQFHPRDNKSKYCSRKCYYASYYQRELACNQCGITFKGRPNRKFCSPECYHQYRKEHRAPPKQPYGPDWKTQRRKALRRDNHTCQECGGNTNGRTSDVHHIIPFREFGIERHKEANQLDNLITLCRSCHMKAHNNF